MPPNLWPRKRASLLFAFVTAAVVIWLMAAAGARADVFDDAQAALEQAAAQTGGAPPPVAPAPDAVTPAPQAVSPAPASPAPVKKVDEPKKSWDTGGVAAPKSVDPVPANVNISIRVQSPGNDGSVIQQDHVTSNADFDKLERDLKRQLDAKFKELQKQVQAPPPKVVMPVIRHVAAKPPPPKPQADHAAKPPPLHSALRTSVLRTSAPRTHPAAPVHERHVHKTAARTHPHPFQLPTLPDNQAMSAGSSGGTSTPPPAPIAALLAAACLAASMLVTTLWDAHRRRRSRLFASRLERPG